MVNFTTEQEIQKVKIKLFTHTDLDGIGCEIVGRLAYGSIFEEISVTHCDYHNVNQIIGDFISNGGYDEYDMVYITDISVNGDIAYIINEKHSTRTLLLDHHKTAEWLNVYPWVYVKTKSDNHVKLNSGTNMFFEYLESQGFFNRKDRNYDALTIFVEKVRRYDTWEWYNTYDDTQAGQLNQLLYLVGRDKFVNDMLWKLESLDMFSYSEGNWHQLFNDTDKAVIKIDTDKKIDYIKRKDKQLLRVPFLNWKVGVVFAEQYISELGNELSLMNQDLNYIAIVDMGNKKVSLRTIHEDIHLGLDVARIFGGGGHSKASGFQFDEKVLTRAFSMIFQAGLLSKILKLIDKMNKK